MSNEVQDLKRQLASGGGAANDAEVETINGVQFLAKRMDGVTGKDLPPLMDQMKQSLGQGVIALFAVDNGRVAAAIGTVGENMPSAKDLIQLVTEKIGGKGGGGRPDMAQGGGTDPAGIDAAIDALKANISG